jgi:tetratricopeptide (TPR) repeat protein
VHKRYDLSAASLAQAVQLQSDNYRAHQLLGLIHVLNRRYPEALEEMRLAALQNPSSAQVRFYYGRLLYKHGNYPQARDEFEACLRVQPGYPKALENLGLCHEALGQYAEAKQAYLQAIDLDRQGKVPSSEDPYIEYGLWLARFESASSGIQMLREALRRNSESARAHFELGRIEWQSGRIQPAELHLMRAAELDPGFSRPHYFLAKLYQRRNLDRKSKLHFGIFRRLDEVPENREARITGRRSTREISDVVSSAQKQ